MKKLLLAAAALSFMAAAPAYAQTHTLQFTGSVEAKCNLPEINTVHDLTSHLALGDDGYLSAGTSGWLTVLNLTNEFGGSTAWCNTAADVSVTGNRLVHDSLPDTTSASSYNNSPVGFTRTLPMQLVNFSVGGAGGVTFPTMNTGTNLDAGNAVTQTSAGPFAGPISGEFQLFLQPRRPWAGNYRTTWRLTFTPS